MNRIRTLETLRRVAWRVLMAYLLLGGAVAAVRSGLEEPGPAWALAVALLLAAVPAAFGLRLCASALRILHRNPA